MSALISPSSRPLRLAVIGAGWAGLAAAVRAALAGHEVSVFEAAREPGGRARAVTLLLPDGRSIRADNGQHILIGAYSATLALMRRVGVEPDALLLRRALALRYPDGRGMALPPLGLARLLPAPVAAALGMVCARGWPWRARLALLRRAHQWQRMRFACAAQASVADLCQGLPAPLLDEFIEPLCVSALNTPPHEASGAVFLRVLHDALFAVAGGADALLPRTDLGQLWPRPALQWLAAQGAQVHLGQRVLALAAAESAEFAESAPGAAWQVQTAQGAQRFDAVVLATSASHALPLLEGALPTLDAQAAAAVQGWMAQTAALRFTAITTVYAQAESDNAAATLLPAPMLALRSGPQAPAQFVFERDALHPAPLLIRRSGEAEHAPTRVLAFVVSNSGAHPAVDLPAAVAAQAQRQLGLPVRVLRSVCEKRATFACTPALERPPAAIAYGLAAAGDYLQGPYPATLEGAMRSGWQALAALGLEDAPPAL